jgi:hypothetical protein
MKIKHIILYSAVLLLSCANSIYKGPHVDPVLKYAYDDWKTECVQRNIKLRQNICDLDSIIYDVLEDRVWGKCFGNKVVINKRAVAPTDTFLIKLIMYHELGHCAFDYRHSELGLDIMNSVLAENKIIAYRWFWDILKEDYFMRYESPKHRSRLKKENGYGEVCIQSKTR